MSYFVTKPISFLDESKAMHWGLIFTGKQEREEFPTAESFHWKIRAILDSWKSTNGLPKFLFFFFWFRFFTYVSSFTSHHMPLIQVRYKQMRDFFIFWTWEILRVIKTAKKRSVDKWPCKFFGYTSLNKNKKSSHKCDLRLTKSNAWLI